MKKILLIFLLIVGIAQAKEEKKSLVWIANHYDVSAKETTIDGKRVFQIDFDEDGVVDNFIFESNEIKIKSQKNIWEIKYFTDLGNLSQIVKYHNEIYLFDGGTGTDFGELTVYLYNKNLNNWFNIANIEHYKDESRRNHYDEDIFTEQPSVDGTIIKIKDKDSLLQITSNIKLMFEQKRFEDIKKVIKSVPFQIDDLSTKNLSSYNDIAYYLQQANANDEAIFLLEKIIEKFPNRTVLYLNLADAYYGINENEEAKVNYEKYIEFMKKSGKENKIPKRVLEYK